MSSEEVRENLVKSGDSSNVLRRWSLFGLLVFDYDAVVARARTVSSSLNEHVIDYPLNKLLREDFAKN